MQNSDNDKFWFLLYMAIFSKFGLQWVASYNPMSAWIPPHAYILLKTALYSVLYTVLYTALYRYTEHSIASCQSALLTFLVSWRTLLPTSWFLYTIPNTTLCTLLNHIHYTVLYTRFYTVLYITFYNVLFTVLYTTVYTNHKVTGWYELIRKEHFLYCP